MAHLDPLPATTTPELAEDFAIFERILGFVPNSLLTMQRRPAIVKGFGELTKAVMDPDGAVDPGFKRLLAHFASRAAGWRRHRRVDRAQRLRRVCFRPGAASLRQPGAPRRCPLRRFPAPATSCPRCGTTRG